jgi:hypothetical protein
MALHNSRKTVLSLFGTIGGGMRWKRILQWVALAAAVPAAFFFYFFILPFILPGGITGPCGYEVKGEKASPDGRLKAAVVEVNCGATTDYRSRAVLTKADRAFDFKKDWLAEIEGRQMQITWEGPKLVVFWAAEQPPAVNEEKTSAPPVEYRPLTRFQSAIEH